MYVCTRIFKIGFLYVGIRDITFDWECSVAFRKSIDYYVVAPNTGQCPFCSSPPVSSAHLLRIALYNSRLAVLM